MREVPFRDEQKKTMGNFSSTSCFIMVYLIQVRDFIFQL